MMHSFNAFSLFKTVPKKPEWNFIRSKRKSREMKDQRAGIRRYFSTSYGKEEAFKQDQKPYASTSREVTLDARLGHIMAYLQICRQHFGTRKIYML